MPERSWRRRRRSLYNRGFTRLAAQPLEQPIASRRQHKRDHEPAAAEDEHTLAVRIASLSLERKVRLLTGADDWSLPAEPALGLRRIVMSDGPAGVRGERWDERDPSANVPSPSALAASWDEALVEEIGALLAFEARRKGVDVLLAPTLNLHRTPYAGRHFECFSEDPLLTARVGAAFVRGVQSGGVAATAKHFIANDSETQRTTVDVRLDERTLREQYLVPFAAAVGDGGAWAAMASYNSVNGCPMTESPLLADLLRGELSFDGVVMSDWFATRTTEASARAGLDLVMPGPDGPWGAALLAAVRRGAVDEATVDDKIRALLRLAARVGALAGGQPAVPRAYDQAAIASTLRRAASAGFVLACNDGVLPLDGGAIRRLAVIGPNAAHGRTLGGGSATIFPPYAVSPLEGLRAAFAPGVRVDHRVGAAAGRRIPVADPRCLRAPGGRAGVQVRFVDADGIVRGTDHRAIADLHLPRSLRHNGSLAWVELHATITAAQAGPHLIGVSGIGRYRLSVDGHVVLDERLRGAPGADVMQSMMIPPQAAREVPLARGQQIRVVLAHEVGSAAAELGDVGLSFALNLEPPHLGEDEELAAAAALAAQADVAVVVVGTTPEVESEGFDRRSLALPGRQDELVRRVAAANARTVVVVNAGAPVLLPWERDVAAVLLAWFPGQEFGHALADVLLGVVEPGGRLPTTWPRDETGLPPTLPVHGTLAYDERLWIGYRDPRRGGPGARYPFGHGLGFSSWEYVSIAAPSVVDAGQELEVEVRVRNRGPRSGREVVQVYARRDGGEVERPAKWLVAFAGVWADPGEEATIGLKVAARAFEHWDVAHGRWTFEPGGFALAAGGSSACLPLATEVTVRAAGCVAVPAAGGVTA